MKHNQDDWRPVPGYENLYSINRNGEVKSFHKTQDGYILRQNICRGYTCVKLSNKGKDSSRNIHRLLAETFIPNPQQKPCVNHINGNKLDNRLTNLEWVTYSENSQHAFRLKLMTFCKKPVIDICAKRRYSSMRSAARANHMSYSLLKSYLNGSRKNPSCFRLILEKSDC